MVYFGLHRHQEESTWNNTRKVPKSDATLEQRVQFVFVVANTVSKGNLFSAVCRTGPLFDFYIFQEPSGT